MDTTFADGSGRINAAWLNDINAYVYRGITPPGAGLPSLFQAYGFNATAGATNAGFNSQLPLGPDTRAFNNEGGAASDLGPVALNGKTTPQNFGADPTGVTDSLGAFNDAIQSVPVGSAVTIVCNGKFYLSAPVSNAGRYPQYEFTPGSGITLTSGGPIVTSTTRRLSWPLRWREQGSYGAEFNYSVNPPDPNRGLAKYSYTLITGNSATGNTTPGYGIRVGYQSQAFGPSAFDIAEAVIANWDRNSITDDGGSGLTTWRVAISPTIGDPITCKWTTFVGEWNVVNRYADGGWSSSRHVQPNLTGIFQVVPESNTFGYGGSTYNVHFGIAIGHSSAPKTDGIPAQFWNGLLWESNSICKSGYGVYAGGCNTGNAAHTPRSFIGTADVWSKPIDLSRSTAESGVAIQVGADQLIQFSTRHNGLVAFTGSLVGATSANLVSNWTDKTGVYLVQFYDGSTAGYQVATRAVTFTQGSTAATWSGAITAGPYITYDGLLFLSAAPGAGATSGTLTSAFSGTTGAYDVSFANGEYRVALLTNGSNAISWAVGLVSAQTSPNLTYQSHAAANFGPCVGSPEGVVAAPVGSFRFRLDGGAGTTFYVKETGGSGNTGWVAK